MYDVTKPKKHILHKIDPGQIAIYARIPSSGFGVLINIKTFILKV